MQIKEKLKSSDNVNTYNTNVHQPIYSDVNGFCVMLPEMAYSTTRIGHFRQHKLEFTTLDLNLSRSSVFYGAPVRTCHLPLI